MVFLHVNYTSIINKSIYIYGHISEKLGFWLLFHFLNIFDVLDSIKCLINKYNKNIKSSNYISGNWNFNMKYKSSKINLKLRLKGKNSKKTCMIWDLR